MNAMTDYLDPEWGAAVLVLIDVQRDFVDGAAVIPGTADRLAAMTALADRFRSAGRPIVHVVRSYRPGESDVDAVRRSAIEAGVAAVQPGTPGADIPVELTPRAVDLDWEALRRGGFQEIGPGEWVMYKPRWSAFHRTGLDERLRDLGATTLVVAGCNLPNCPRATLFDASERDYRTVLATDATSQATRERLADLELIGVRLRTVEQIAEGLHGPSPSS